MLYIKLLKNKNFYRLNDIEIKKLNMLKFTILIRGIL